MQRAIDACMYKQSLVIRRNNTEASQPLINSVRVRATELPDELHRSTSLRFVCRTRSRAHIASETYMPSITSKIPMPPLEATKPIGLNRIVRNTSVKLAVETMNVTKPPYLRNAVKRPTAMPMSMAKTRCTTGDMGVANAAQPLMSWSPSTWGDSR